MPSEHSEPTRRPSPRGFADPAAQRLKPFGSSLWLTAGERELERVHRGELAALLRQATALSAARLVSIAPFPLRRPSIRLWRRRVRATLSALVTAGWSPPGLALLDRLVQSPLQEWPSVARLARVARRVEDSELARVCLGYSLLAEHDAAGAERLFAGLLKNEPTLRHRWRILEGLALAHAVLGRPLLALGAIEAAADEPFCGISTLVNGLHLALIAGDAERSQRAAARLDLLADPYSPEFSAAVRCLKDRLEEAGEEPWRPDERTRSLFHELLREGRSAAGRVCRALT